MTFMFCLHPHQDDIKAQDEEDCDSSKYTCTHRDTAHKTLAGLCRLKDCDCLLTKHSTHTNKERKYYSRRTSSRTQQRQKNHTLCTHARTQYSTCTAQTRYSTEKFWRASAHDTHTGIQNERHEHLQACTSVRLHTTVLCTLRASRPRNKVGPCAPLSHCKIWISKGIR